MKYAVLCVDDEVHNLETLERLLRKDYRVLKATSGKEGLEILDKESVALIISDQRMPEMTGVEFLGEAIKTHPEAIRILLTGYTDLESVIGAINTGQIYRYITKPWDNDELLQIVKQAVDVFHMRRTIEQQNEELKSLDKLKTDFVLLVNHELRTPLTAITSYTQLLEEENITDDQKLYLKKINQSTQRLENLIKDTLLITKLKSGSEPAEKQAVDITELIDSLWETISKEFPNKKLQLDVKADRPFQQDANFEFIKILLTKLITNGFQHAKPDSHLEIELQSSDGGWSLITRNQSEKPIEKRPEELLNAFAKDENILNHTGGTGLGLAVVESIAKLFKGKIDLKIDGQKFELSISFPI